LSKTRFSICIPNYNYGRYLKDTLDSVLNQKYAPYEIIISDNSSSDNSVEIVKSYDSSLIKLVENKYNIGYSGNIHKVTSMATGDYIVFLPADDLLKDNALADYAAIIERFGNQEREIIISGQVESLYNNKVIRTIGPKMGKIEKKLGENYVSREPDIEIFDGKDIFKILMTTDFTVHGPSPATCFPKSLFDKVEGYNSPVVIIPDATLSHKLCFMNPKVIYFHKPLAYFRLHESNNTADLDRVSNIKILTDKYIISHEFSEDQLKSVGLNRGDLKNAFIKNWCVNVPFQSLYSGKIAKFYHYFIFGFASYPSLMLKQFKTYIVFLLIIFSPIFWLAGKFYRKVLK
tara:strand:- start:212 stop:1249 length:1038 start_codon:yes stop_codon:yes gene_type:complete